MATGKNYKVVSVGAFSAIGGFLFGYEIAVISGVLTMSDFKRKMNTTDYNSHHGDDKNSFDVITASIVGVLLFGCFVGSLIGGQSSDRFSRKYSICFFSIVFTIGAAMQTWFPARSVFFIGRFISGMSVGSLSMIGPVYHSEIAETKVRGRIMTLQQWAITIGIATSFWVNVATSNNKHFQDPSYTWRIPLGIQMGPAMILAIGILFCPFSPRWLISHDREDEARDVLMNIRSASYDEVEVEMDRIKNEVAYLRENEIESYRQLLRPPLLRPFLLGIGIQILQQLTGMNPIIYYAPRFFNGTVNMNDTNINPILLVTGINGCVNFVATIPTMIFIDKLGRRILLITGAIGMSISMMVVAILAKPLDKQDTNHHGSWSLIVFVYLFVASYAFSWGPIPWVYCAEIFPLTMRAKATSITTAANWATNCAMSILALRLLQIGIVPAAISFSIFCALMIGIVYFFYPETRNRHLEESGLGENNGIFVRQWSEGRRNNYDTFTEHRIVNQAQILIPREQNSIDQSNQINNSDLAIERDDDLCENNCNSNVAVS